MNTLIFNTRMAPQRVGTIEDWVRDNVECNARTNFSLQRCYQDYAHWCRRRYMVALPVTAYIQALLDYGFELKTVKVDDNLSIQYVRRIDLKSFRVDNIG